MPRLAQFPSVADRMKREPPSRMILWKQREGNAPACYLGARLSSPSD